NAQSNALENVFARSGISYKVIGGFRFFERKEIKDVLAYLCVINNNNDDLRLRRIINEPKRGIGDTTVNNAAQIASELGVSLFEVFKRADEFASLSRAALKLKEFCSMITELTDLSENLTLHELFSEMIDKSGYKLALINEGIEGKERIENVEEFASTIMQYEMENEQPSLSAFLEEIALVSDIDSMDNEDDKVVLMTVHSAKGLEFNTVYLIGMEEGIFPGNQSIYGGPEEIEEERRLAYVAITRAKKQLNISNAYTRMIFGTTNRNMASRFLREIPMELCDVTAGSAMRGFTTGTQYSNSSAPTYKTANTYKSSIITQSSSKKPLINYNIGQRVEHKTFGVGTVTAVTPMGNDSMLVIEFDSIGTKKIMAQFANLKVL
ncbi:MAG: 3'-5' exonuclease, partial [Acutalibacteraceae bacterium]|nr:3'-5' exonuclease [Acutalibacteraceae bacterium]